jgi:outer membrane lipoprotein LolB
MSGPARALGAALLAVGLLVGCAHLEPGHDGLGFDERRQRLEAIPAWEMRGRLAVNTGERAFQGSFRWLQDDAHSTLTVRGPLGGGILEVAGSRDRMIVTARGEQRVLEDPETELSGLLGWWMPVDSLRAWLLGLPDAQFRAATRFGPDAALEALDQRLWHVEYASYQLSDGLLVPRRIDLAHGALELRLTVDAWSPTPAHTPTRLELGAAAPAK